MSRIKEILKQLSRWGWRFFNGIKSCFYTLSISSAVYDANILLYIDVLTTCITKECKPKISEFHWNYFSCNYIFLGWPRETPKQKIAEIMFKCAINVCEFASKWQSYDRRFFQSQQLFTILFFPILSFFGVVAVFNFAFFRKFNTVLIIQSQS